MSEKNEGYEYGLIAGVVAGLVAGILFAPTSGSKSRKKIKDTVIKFNEEHGKDIECAKKQLSTSCDLLRYNIEKQFRLLENKISAKKLRKAKELEEPYLYDTEMN